MVLKEAPRHCRKRDLYIFLADLGFVLQGVFEMMQQFDRPEFAADITFLQQEQRGVVLNGFAHVLML